MTEAAPTATDPPEPGRWPYLLVGLAVLGVGVAGWSPVPAGVWHDDGVYMLVGKAIAGGHGLTYDGVVGSPPAAKFPPLYSGFLATLWLVFRSIGAVTLAATLANLAFLGVAAGLFAKVLRESTELPLRWCAAIALLAFSSSDVLRTALVPLSEPLFIAITMAVLLFWTRAWSGAQGRDYLWLAVALSAAVLTRSAGVAWVVAVGVTLGARHGVRAAALTAGPAVAAMVAWGAWSGAMAERIPEGTRDLLGPYGGWLADQALASPGSFVSALPAHVVGLAERVAALTIPGLSGWALAAAALPLAVTAALGLVRVARRAPVLPLLVAAYLGMLVLWPYLDRRLVVPIFPIVVAAVGLGAWSLLERLEGARLRSVLVGAMTSWVVAFSIVTAGRIARDWPVAAYRLRAERLAAAVEALSQTAPPTAVVGAPEYWAALHLHGGWTVSPSVRFDPRRVDPEEPMWGTTAEQLSLWRGGGIDHLLLEQAGALHGDALDQLEDECPGSVFLLAQSPPLMVVRLEFAAECPLGS